jgi:ActR/RegA family two-component response regulator
MTDAVLIVDDEESVRRTFQDWLTSSDLEVQVFATADAESALRVANDHPIDLAVLDWNLGSGSDGLRLLEDLIEFQPEIVAILVTGFAHVATPLHALRMGVRDYLDKNTDLTRETFLTAIRRQLDRIRPVKRQRELNRSLAAFREAVEKVVPLVRTVAALNDPVPLPEAVKSLLGLLIQVTRAADGVIVLHHVDQQDGEQWTAARGLTGEPLVIRSVPFARTLAASVISHQEAMILNDLKTLDDTVELLPFETNRAGILAVPIPVGGGTAIVLELFDKPAPGFTSADRHLVSAVAEIGASLLRQALAERQSHKLLFDAIEAALEATAGVTEVLTTPAETPPQAVIERLKEGLALDSNAIANPEITLRLVEAVRGLAIRHGPIAVEHCVHVVSDLHKLLDSITGTGV